MSLVGKKIVLSVGEPWDFESPDGTNLIEAEVVAFDGMGLVAEADHEVFVPDKRLRGTRLVMKTRYYGSRLSDLALAKNVMVGVAVVPSGKSDKAAKYALIGSVCLKGVKSDEYSGVR